MKVLFVDDEPRRMQPIIEELQDKGYDVVLEENVDYALARLEDQKAEFDLVIVDVSMPASERFRSEDTEEGTRTGLVFYDAVRHLQPRLKIIVFTNVADRTVEEHFRKEDPSLYRFIRKPSVLPYEFVEEIENFIRTIRTNIIQ